MPDSVLDAHGLPRVFLLDIIYGTHGCYSDKLGGEPADLYR